MSTHEEDILRAQIRQQLHGVDILRPVKIGAGIIGVVLVVGGLLGAGYLVAKHTLSPAIVVDQGPAISEPQAALSLLDETQMKHIPDAGKMVDEAEPAPEPEPVLAENRVIDYRGMFGAYEGETDRVYLCPTGHPTAGVGHSFQVGSRIPEWMIEPLFHHDLLIAMEDADYAVSKYDLHLDQVRYAAVVNIAYMTGRGRLMEFKTMLTALKNKRWKDAAVAWEKTRAAATAGDLRRKGISKMISDGKTEFWKPVGWTNDDEA